MNYYFVLFCLLIELFKLSGIQKHLIATSAGLVIGKVVDGWRNDYLAERDAVLRHYIELHPEDFLATGLI